MKASLPGPERLLGDSLILPTLATWKEGHRFQATDDKLLLLFGLPLPADSISGIKGHHLAFAGIKSRQDAGGSQGSEIILEDADGNGRQYRLPVRRSVVSMDSATALDLPMLIDLEAVAHTDSILRGRRVWTNSRLWYSPEGNRLSGRKFCPVVITGVTPGNTVFPFFVSYVNEAGLRAGMFMSPGGLWRASRDTRRFDDLFLLSDPKEKYKTVTDENWEAICAGRVNLGMTKEECRLALGSPSDVDGGHNWSSTIDLWRYADGSYLRFEDGLLVAYRLL